MLRFASFASALVIAMPAHANPQFPVATLACGDFGYFQSSSPAGVLLIPVCTQTRVICPRGMSPFIDKGRAIQAPVVRCRR